MPFLVTIKRSGGCTCSFSCDPEVHEEAAPSIYLKVLKRIRVNKVNHGKTARWPSFAACDDNTLKSIYFLHSTILPATEMATHENSWTVILDRVDEALVSALLALQSLKISLLLRLQGVVTGTS